ncbi:MAG: hypothetical protein GY943_26115 [Chloroflexi bacterium]|nr:hypothetical protein [Chloroflexota bacterium]
MKLYHTNGNHSWRPWISPERTLPTHLPRLLLANRYQPRFVRRCQVTQSLIPKLELLDWEQLPTTLAMQYSGERTIPLAAYVGAYLVKLDQQLPTFAALRRFLRSHPAMVWALGFPLLPHHWRFDADLSLPSQRHFSKKLSTVPNEILQTLIDGQVSWLQEQLGQDFGQTISLDTKHILAWVRENNPKAYIKEGRFDKTQQPDGDLDCKLGCKRRRNQITPTKEGKPANKKVSIGEFYWGYASGAVVTKIPAVGEFVLAEFTQTFDYGDLTYFLPLMAQVEQRLGFRPRYATADAAFDAWYFYDYFYSTEHDGFAAVPLRQMKQGHRQFDPAGLPLCAAGLSMPRKGVFTNRTSLVQHQRGRYVCPLLYPEPSGDACPIEHEKWHDGGCKTIMPTAVGARIRYQLDRESERYKAVYKQRTAVERIFSQAVALGIERPKLRNRLSITNLNTLTYVLINLRAMQRLLDASN